MEEQEKMGVWPGRRRNRRNGGPHPSRPNQGTRQNEARGNREPDAASPLRPSVRNRRRIMLGNRQRITLGRLSYRGTTTQSNVFYYD